MQVELSPYAMDFPTFTLHSNSSFSLTPCPNIWPFLGNTPWSSPATSMSGPLRSHSAQSLEQRVLLTTEESRNSSGSWHWKSHILPLPSSPAAPGWVPSTWKSSYRIQWPDLFFQGWSERLQLKSWPAYGKIGFYIPRLMACEQCVSILLGQCWLMTPWIGISDSLKEQLSEPAILVAYPAIPCCLKPCLKWKVSLSFL